jgi:deoxyribodipyrimidine photo-lyase
LGYDPLASWIEPGERNAQKRLHWFVEGPIHSYATNRNLPANDGCSQLSPHFRFGTLSPRRAIHAALSALAKGGRVSRPDVLTWVDELIWREFFQQVLASFPHVADGPFRKVAIPPSRESGPERDGLFQAWCHGQAGYPIVDAGIRQLNQTGWMHNRVRMVAASFLIKDLRIDWQSGERYFMQHLIDADVAANNGNWQWCASTGTDAMRGYRIFNPVLQSKKFDPDGAYIRRYVPELAHVSTKRIHEPHLMTADEQARAGCRIGLDYPSPVVDHQLARQEYLNLGKQEATR